MTVKVVSFSISPLAGAPIRIARAVSRYSDIEVRHVDLKRWGIFEHDHVHEEDAEKTLMLAEQADIIHLFNYLDLNSSDFAPVDFRALHRRGVRFVRMFESTPMRVAQRMGQSLEAVLNDPIPKLVIAQYPERFLPSARVVPNIVMETDPAYVPLDEEPPNLDVVFSPSWQHSAWVARWDTKGMPETNAVLERLSQKWGLECRVIQGRPLEEVLQAKRRAKLVIDELVTGRYHLSGLEGLSLGKPVLVYLDERTERVLRVISGSDVCPFVNVRLEDAEYVLLGILQHEEERIALGQVARRWVEQHWSAARLVEHYIRVYEDLLEDPTRIRRQPELAIDDPVERMRALIIPDLIYHARADQYIKNLSWFVRAGRAIHMLCRKTKMFAKRWLPDPIWRLLQMSRHLLTDLT